MNVIIANQQKEIIAGLDIDIIKSLDGEFDADELVSMFQNFYFGKMILDLTAVRDYKNLQNIQKLSMALDVEKIIILLPASDPECTSNAFLSQLISMGIYNFTTNLEGLKYLFDHPNTYRDVAHIQQLGQLSAGEGGDGGTGTVVNVTVQGDVNQTATVLGFKNLTDHAGATSLIYMIKKQLEHHGVPVIAIELNKRDFMYFNDKSMLSLSVEQLPAELLKHKDVKVILLDINDTNSEESCGDVFYLLEPSTIKLNKLLRRDRNVFQKMKAKKIVLNRSLLSSSDVADLEYEAKAKIFYSLPPLNDRINNNVLDDFLSTIGVLKVGSGSSSKSGGMFSFFK